MNKIKLRLHFSYVSLDMVKQCRHLILFAFILSLLIHVFLLSTNINLASFLATFFLVMISIGFESSEEIFFFMATLLLSSAMVFLLLGGAAIGEKLTLWTVSSIAVGLCTGLYRLRFGSLNKRPIFLFSKISAYFVRFISEIPLLKLLTFLKKKVYGKPQKPSEYFISACRILLIGEGFFFLLLLTNLYIFRPINSTVRQYLLAQKKLEMKPKIEKIEPGIIYTSNTVVVFGSNMGWRQNEKVKLMSQFGPLNASSWTDQKIIFTVPLHWKKGQVHIWLEKPIDWLGTREITRSNIYDIRLIPVTLGKWNTQDDAYFEQLKYLESEVLELNGYR